VAAPGTYRLAGTFRLLDAVKMANNQELPSLTEFNYREMECRNRDSLRYYDEFKFLFKNDLSQNPYVYPGDNIALAYAKTRVFLHGSIKNPITGTVPIKQDEPLAEFLSLFTLTPRPTRAISSSSARRAALPDKTSSIRFAARALSA